MHTNPDGIFRFSSLPPGTYTIQALIGLADITRIVPVAADSKVRSDLRVEPERAYYRT